MKTLGKLIGLLEKPQRAALGRFALLCLLSPAADLFSVSMIIPVLQQAFQQEVSSALAGQIVILSLLLLLVGAFELLKGRVSTALVMDISHDWSVKIYELYGIESLEEHNRKTAMQAINGARMDPAVCAGMITAYMSLAVDLLTTAAYALVVIYIAQGIGMVSCLLLAALMGALYLYSRVHTVLYGEKKRRLEIKTGGMVSTTFGSYKEVKIDSRRGNLLEKYGKASAECARVQKDYLFTRGLQGVVLSNIMQAALFLFLAAILVGGVDVPHVLPEIMIFITLLIRMLPVAKRIVETLTTLQYASKYYEELRAALDRYAALKEEQAGRMGMRERQITLAQGIRVEDISFQYPNGKQIFEHASIDIPAGHSIAVIGPSGEGKTTLLDLILGLLHPQSGHIWYDDFDLVEGRDSFGPCCGDVGTVVSYIPQIVYLDNETVRNNVVFMADEEEMDEKRLIECLQCAQIWEDVQEMPDGLDTVIGQNGSVVSGGQRQRIALARALYKQFEILVMDEATAALDIDTERAVIDSIRQMKGNKTLLMVTHHLSLANECEYVYKLENRRLVRVR